MISCRIPTFCNFPCLCTPSKLDQLYTGPVSTGFRSRQRRLENERHRPTRAYSERAGINAGRTLKTNPHQHAWLERFPINAGFTDPRGRQEGHRIALCGAPLTAPPRSPQCSGAQEAPVGTARQAALCFNISAGAQAESQVALGAPRKPWTDI